MDRPVGAGRPKFWDRKRGPGRQRQGMAHPWLLPLRAPLGALLLLAGAATLAGGDSPTPMPPADPIAPAGSPLVPADSAAVAYEGRTAPGPDQSVRLGFPGVTAHLRFAGPTLLLQAEATNDKSMFDVIVDGLAPVLLRLHPGLGTYPVYGGSPGRHTVALVRRNESWRGTCALVGFFTPGGEMMRAPALPRPP